jgi:hypothetical protein
VLTTSFEENPRLKDFFKVLALSLDNKGLPYIALMEAKKVREGARWHRQTRHMQLISCMTSPA